MVILFIFLNNEVVLELFCTLRRNKSNLWREMRGSLSRVARPSDKISVFCAAPGTNIISNFNFESFAIPQAYAVYCGLLAMAANVEQSPFFTERRVSNQVTVKGSCSNSSKSSQNVILINF